MSDWQWNSGPLSEGDDIQSWGVFRQFYDAVDERWAVVNNQKERCCGNWPRSQVVWGQGVVSAITATTLTPDEMPEKCGGINPVDHNWTSGCAGINAVPTSWDIVIDDCDPTKVVRAHVASNNDTTFTISDISDYATSKFIASLSSLAGKTFYLIKSNGPWWSERWMQWPNDWEYARGTVSSATTSSLTVGQQSWASDLTGKDLLVFAGGRLRRVSVSSNTADTINFTTQTWTPGGTFIVVAAGGKGDPNRQSDYCYRWDSSPQNGYYTHYPDDSTVNANTPPATGLPSNSVKWQEGETSCDEVDCKSFETDCWSSLTNECSEADKAFNRDLYRTVRGIALGAFELSGNFIDPQTGVPLVPATWFYRAGVNATKVTSSGRDGDSNLLVTLSPPFEPIEIYYAVLGKSGCVTSDQIDEILTSGKGYYQDGKIIGDFNNVLYDTPREVVLTYGLSQPIEREFRWRGERRVFVPEQQANAINCGDEAPSAADPPNIANFDLCGCLGVGGYELRGKSTHYCEPYTGNAGGASNPNGKIIEGPDEFQVGDRARWIGDNWNDPAIPGPIQASSPTPFTTIYYDRMVEMRHKPETQAQLIAQLRGVAVSGTNHSLAVEDQDWWNEFWYPKGSGRVETGTFTGGSTTGGTDSTKGASYEIVGYDEETFEPIYGWVPTEEGCWWSMSRFLFDGSASAYEYFIIEILIGAVWHKRVIRVTTQDDGGVTVSWNEPLPASANGKQYRIREAIGYVVNRFRGRTATLTEPDGVTTHEVTIIGNDDKSLFWDAAGFTVGEDWSYSIDDPTIDPAPGGVYEWDGSDWQLVEGGVPDRVMRYGIWPNLLLKGTVIGLHTLNELRALINVLSDTYKGVTVSSRADDEVPESNEKRVDYVAWNCGNNYNTHCRAHWPECWGNETAGMTCDWNCGSGGTRCDGSDCGQPYSCYFSEESALPYAEWIATVCTAETMCGGGVGRRYCYVSVSNISTCRPVQVEIWGKARAYIYDCPSQWPEVACGSTFPYPQKIQYDTNGDGDYGWGKWQKITTLTEIDDDGTTVKYRIGNQSFPIPGVPPTPCSPVDAESPSNPAGYTATYRGYRMTAVKAVLKWTFNHRAAA